MANGSQFTRNSVLRVSVNEPSSESAELVGSGCLGIEIFAKIGKSVKVGKDHGPVVPINPLHGGLISLNFVQ